MQNAPKSRTVYNMSEVRGKHVRPRCWSVQPTCSNAAAEGRREGRGRRVAQKERVCKLGNCGGQVQRQVVQMQGSQPREKAGQKGDKGKGRCGVCRTGRGHGSAGR